MRRLNLMWMALLGLTWALGVSACSDNETEHGDGGSGGTSGDGGTGNGGNGGNGGGSPTTTTTSGGGNGSSEIGTACESSQDCQTGLSASALAPGCRAGH